MEQYDRVKSPWGRQISPEDIPGRHWYKLVNEAGILHSPAERNQKGETWKDKILYDRVRIMEGNTATITGPLAYEFDHMGAYKNKMAREVAISLVIKRHRHNDESYPSIGAFHESMLRVGIAVEIEDHHHALMECILRKEKEGRGPPDRGELAALALEEGEPLQQEVDKNRRYRNQLERTEDKRREDKKREAIMVKDMEQKYRWGVLSTLLLSRKPETQQELIQGIEEVNEEMESNDSLKKFCCSLVNSMSTARYLIEPAGHGKQWMKDHIPLRVTEENREQCVEQVIVATAIKFIAEYLATFWVGCGPTDDLGNSEGIANRTAERLHNSAFDAHICAEIIKYVNSLMVLRGNRKEEERRWWAHLGRLREAIHPALVAKNIEVGRLKHWQPIEEAENQNS